MPHTPTDAPALREELREAREALFLHLADHVETERRAAMLKRFEAAVLAARQSGAAGALTDEQVCEFGALCVMNRKRNLTAREALAEYRQERGLAAPSKADVLAVRERMTSAVHACYAETGQAQGTLGSRCFLAGVRWADANHPQQPSQAAGEAPKGLKKRLETLRLIVETTVHWAPAVRRESAQVINDAIAALSRPPAPPEGARVPGITAYQEDGLFCVTFRSASLDEAKKVRSLLASPEAAEAGGFTAHDLTRAQGHEGTTAAALEVIDTALARYADGHNTDAILRQLHTSREPLK